MKDKQEQKPRFSRSWAQANWITIPECERGEEPWAGGFRIVLGTDLALHLQSLGGLKTPLTQQLVLLKAGHGRAGLAGEGRGSQRNPGHHDFYWMCITLVSFSSVYF